MGTRIDELRPLADPEAFAMARLLVDATAGLPADDANRVFAARVIDDAITRGLANACGRVTLADMHAAIYANGGGVVSREALPGDPEFVPTIKPRKKRSTKGKP